MYFVQLMNERVLLLFISKGNLMFSKNQYQIHLVLQILLQTKRIAHIWHVKTLNSSILNNFLSSLNIFL